MQLYRAKIDQPSTIQPLHSLHSKVVIVADIGGDTVRLHFAEGDLQSLYAPRLCVTRQFLSEAHREAASRGVADSTATSPPVVYRATLDQRSAPVLPANLHGKAVIVADRGADDLTVYFTEGDVHSMMVPRDAVARDDGSNAYQALPDPAQGLVGLDLQVMNQFIELSSTMKEAWATVYRFAEEPLKQRWLALLHAFGDFANVPPVYSRAGNARIYAAMVDAAPIVRQRCDRELVKALYEQLLVRHSDLAGMREVGPTKRVELRLSALTRVDFSEVVEVPADITDEELNHLINQRYRDVDGGQYVPDPEFWERGTCYVVAADAAAVPDVVATRVHGGLVCEAAPTDDDTPLAPAPRG